MFLTKSNYKNIHTSILDASKRKGVHELLEQELIQEVSEINKEFVVETIENNIEKFNRKYSFNSRKYQISSPSYHSLIQCDNLNSPYRAVDFTSVYDKNLMPPFENFKEWFLENIPFNEQDNPDFISQKINDKYGVSLNIKTLNLPNSGIRYIYNFSVGEIAMISTSVFKLISLINNKVWSSDESWFKIIDGCMKDFTAQSNYLVELFEEFLDMYFLLYNTNNSLLSNEQSMLEIIGLNKCVICSSNISDAQKLKIRIAILKGAKLSNLKGYFTEFDIYLLGLFGESVNVKLDDRVKLLPRSEIHYVGWAKIVHHSITHGYIVEVVGPDKKIYYLKVNHIDSDAEIYIGKLYFCEIQLIDYELTQLFITKFDKSRLSILLDLCCNQDLDFFDC